MKLGFIGQGFIGKNYADDFESRGYTVVRYTRSEPFNKNKEALAECDIVFIAVPTPTTPDGFDATPVRGALALVGVGKIAVIKSTVLPGTTAAFQKEYPDRIILHAPEFLREATAAYDAAHPTRNIVGVAEDTDTAHAAAEAVLAILPEAPVTMVVASTESELIKYAANCFLHIKVVYANLLFDLGQKLGANWEHVKEGMGSDPRIGMSHLDVVGKDGARGAGGHCFIKDFAALRELYEKALPEEKESIEILKSLEDKNVSLLRSSNKDGDLLKGVYGV
jgi:UDPglucose 6-dehydrogenase